MSYSHIPLPDRLAIAWQVRFGKPDDLIDIRADRIVGAAGAQYGAALYGMHFGRNTRCDETSRAAWPAGHTEPARAYCRGHWCVVIPEVCGNVSWITRDPAVAPTIRRVPAPATGGLALTALAAAAYTTRRRSFPQDHKYD